MADFALLKQKYRRNPVSVLQQLVGQGKIEGSDYVALNPKRKDGRLGSFRIDIKTGRYHDFATGDKGGSIIDLVAFVYNCGIVEAAQRLEGLFPFLARQSITVQGTLAKKKEVDILYIWKKSTVSKHDYLRKKKISIGNAKVNFYKGNTRLVIPLTDSCSTTESDLKIKGLQFIDEDGLKRFFCSVKGLFHVASDYEKPKDIIVIAEGYATARSIAESTDFFVIGSMSSCNMKNVAEKIAEQFPNSEIIIAADNDEAGRKAVTEAQKAISGKVSCAAIYPLPEFNDFNDMYQAVGDGAVTAYFEEVFHA